MPGPTVYVERSYQEPAPEVIRYVPIEQAPLSDPYAPTIAGSAAPSFLQQGDAVFRQGRYDEARRLYTRALLADEADPAAQLSYAFAHFAVGRHNVAAMALRRALASDPELMDTPPDPRAAYGVAGDFEQHLVGLQQCQALLSRDSEALLLLAYVAHATGETRSALEYLDRLLALDETDTLAYVLRDAILGSTAGMSEQSEPATGVITPPV